MLSRIHIQNFAIATSAEVELETGMTVLTGETGAGKSILIDALNLALGDRADAGVVRHGTDRATIDVSFELDEHSPALAWLREQAMDDGNDCHLRRIISVEGRSRAFINNQSTTLGALKALGEMLVDIHGQHEHQSLMKPARQRELLDSAGDYKDLLKQTRALAGRIQSLQAEYDALQQTVRDNEAHLQLLRYQIQELDELQLADLDIPALLKEHDQISHAASLQELGWSLLNQISEDEDQALQSRLGRMIAQLEPWLQTSDALRNISDLLQNTLALSEDAGRELQHFLDRLESDPKRATELDAQVGALHNLARKHHIRIEDLQAFYAERQAEMSGIDNNENRLNELQTELTALKAEYRQLATELHQQRLQTAQDLSEKVTAIMQKLGMQGGRFEIQVTADMETGRISAHGLDEIGFLVSANPGQPVQALQKVASGGELSRISLAITVITANSQRVPTMIFDEVDSGIGGATAEIVGQQLKTLGHERQVLCVTHLPQVAAQADHHFRIIKASTDTHTESRVLPLHDDSRIEEIARMLGGMEITAQTLAHAEELLNKGNTAKAS